MARRPDPLRILLDAARLRRRVVRDLESAKQELDFLLQQSVREHLLSDVPLGVWLSGGIDSSTILHYAASTNHARLKTFSISFNGRSFDETEHIQRVVSHYGTDHEQLDLNPQEDLQGAIEQFAYYSDEPSADAGALPVWFLSRMCKTHATVALSGEGADEIFAGYLTYRANQLARQARTMPARAIELALDGLRFWPVSDEKISLEYKLKRFLEGCLLSPERAHVHWNGTFSEPAKAALLRRPLARRHGQHPGRAGELAAHSDGLYPYLAFDQQYYLADDILVKSDRMSMAHAVEVRPPFLDHRIVEFAATLPDTLKMRGSRQKLLLKELMKDKLPPSILNRKKVGFDIPAHEWLRGSLRPLLLDTLKEGLSEHADLFRADTIESYLRLHLERRANLGYHLWGLMILFLWMKQWRIQSTPASTARTTGPGGRRGWHTYLAILLLIAAAVYLACILSPPSLMDDVDAVQAQIARNMLDLRRLGHGASRRGHLPGEGAAHLLADGHLLQSLRHLRLGGAHSHRAFLDRRSPG